MNFSQYPRYKTYLNHTILAIDFGFKVVGTAFFKVGIDPFPLSFEKIIYQNTSQTLIELQKIIDNESVDIIVFGIPYFIDGKASDMTKKLQEIAQLLRQSNPKKLFFEQDETLTTETAKERMKNSPEYNFKIDLTKVDCLSATIILEDFLRS